MKLTDYLRERLVFLTVNLLLFSFLATVMLVLKVRIIVIFVTFFIWFTPLITYSLLQFCQQKSFLDELTMLSESLDQAYLLSEVVKKPDYLEGKLYYKALKAANRSMLERVNEYQTAQKDYREYVETWVHEIKTPIASAQLIIDNHKNEVTRGINIELKRIDNYVEQALYYAKSNTVNEDYKIRECALAAITKKAISRNAQDLIRQNFSVDMSAVEGNVNTDPKWVEFILNQIIGNAVKYCREDARKLVFSTKSEKNCRILTIQDNGIGIPQKDLAKVFDKGYTGENGRMFGKSTGIGLYLCKKLCDRLRIGISLESFPAKGTAVQLIFPIGDLNMIAKDFCK